MNAENRNKKALLEATVTSAQIRNLVSFQFVGSCNKHSQYLCHYEYAADCWESLKAKAMNPNGKYDYFNVHGEQKKIESNVKKPIVQAIKKIAKELDIKIRLIGHNKYHHDKFDFNSDLYRRTGHVTSNM